MRREIAIASLVAVACHFDPTGALEDAGEVAASLDADPGADPAPAADAGANPGADADLGTVTCAGGEPCCSTFSCSQGGDCKPKCPDLCLCHVDCVAASNCDFECRKGSECLVDCRQASNCRGSCRHSGTTCDIDCSHPQTSNCEKIRCRDGASCLIRCASSTANCGFDRCHGGETSCADNVVVCNRGCP